MARAVPIKSLHDAGLKLLDGAVETLTSSRDDEAVHAARKAAKRYRAPASHSEVASAVAGARKSYKAGRSACAQAKSRDDLALHEWRKQAKYLLNQLELLRAVFNVDFKKLHRRADRLADILGTDHDLGVLLSKLPFYDANSQSLVKHLKKRRHKLQARPFRVGKKLYRRSAKRFATDLRARLGGARRSRSA